MSLMQKRKMCAVMIGDIRKCGKEIVPLIRMIEFLRVGFINEIV